MGYELLVDYQKQCMTTCRLRYSKASARAVKTEDAPRPLLRGQVDPLPVRLRVSVSHLNFAPPASHKQRNVAAAGHKVPFEIRNRMRKLL